MGTIINIIGPKGEAANVDEEDLQGALDQGYRIATSDEVYDQHLRDVAAGNVADGRPTIIPLGPMLIPVPSEDLGKLAAMTGSAADAMTFGAFGRVLSRVAPQSARVLGIAQEENPVSSGIGTVGGIAGGFANPALKTVSKIGGAVGEKVSELAGNTLGKVAQFGTEGALVSTPRAAAELFTGDPEEAAETMLHGSAFGGGLGLGASAAGALPAFLRAVSEKGGEALGKAKEFAAAQFGDSLKSWEVAQGGRLIGLNKAYLKKMGTDRAEELVEWANENKLFDVSKDAAERSVAIQEIKEKAASTLGDVFKRIDDTGKKFIDVPQMLERMRKVEVPQGELFAPERNAYEKAMADIESTVLDRRGQPKMISFKTLQGLKSDLGGYAWKDFAQVRPGRELVASLERVVNDTIGESLVYAEKTVPGQKKLWEDAKLAYRNVKDLEKPLNELIAAERGNQFIRPSDLGTSMTAAAAGGYPGAFGGYVASSVRHAYGGQVAYKLLRSVNGFLEGRNAAIEDGVDQFYRAMDDYGNAFPASAGPSAVERVGEAAQKLGKAAEKTAPNSLSALETLTGDGKSDRAQKLAQLNDSLAAMTANPTRTAEILSTFTPEVSKASPETAVQLQKKLLETASYLQRYIPKSQEQPNPFVQDTFHPPDQAVASFERRLATALDPYSVISELKAGALSPESVQTLKELYPYFYQKLARTILSKAAEKKRNLPFQKRMELSLLLGGRTDDVMKPESVSILQQSFLQPELKPPPAPGGRGSSFSNDLQTEVQRVSQK